MHAKNCASDLYPTRLHRFTWGTLSCTFHATKFQKFLYVDKNGILIISTTTTDVDILQSAKGCLLSRDRTAGGTGPTLCILTGVNHREIGPRTGQVFHSVFCCRRSKRCKYCLKRSVTILSQAFTDGELQRACRCGFGVFGSKDIESQQGRYYPAFRKVERTVLYLPLEAKRQFSFPRRKSMRRREARERANVMLATSTKQKSQDGYLSPLAGYDFVNDGFRKR
jgi:hypothetical protein